MKGAELFVRCLECERTRLVFGVPGEECADLLLALEESKIQFVVCRHEQGAAFMADMVGRLTGEAGVCLSTLGPGATNLVTGVANANLDRSPVVAITGQADTQRLHKESHQVMDVVGLFKPITKWTHSVYHADNIPEVVRKAFKRATAEKPGAAHIELPEDIAKMPTSESPVEPKPVRRPAPDYKAVRAALEMIAEARSPVILAGNGCVRKRAAKQLGIFMEKTGIYAATTFMGKGAVSARHRQCLFTAGLQARDQVIGAFEQADLVLAIGYELAEWHPSNWNRGSKKRILHIDFEPAEVDQYYRPDCEVVADIASSLWSINEELTAKHQKESSGLASIRAAVASVVSDGADDAGFPMKPQRILADTRSVMGDRDILISDVGAHKIWVARHYPAYEPNTCIISNGFCSMGMALPGAVAAKMVCPERNVLAVCGDGGFLMNVQELATAVMYKVPVVAMVWVDGGYGLIEWKEQNQFGRSAFNRFENPDFAALAKSFGARGFKVEAADELKPALREAFAEREKPTVIAVPVDYRENLKLTAALGTIVARS